MSVLYFVLPLSVMVDKSSEGTLAAIVLISSLTAYWGYRFIKGDISFLKNDRTGKEGY